MFNRCVVTLYIFYCKYAGWCINHTNEVWWDCESGINHLICAGGNGLFLWKWKTRWWQDIGWTSLSGTTIYSFGSMQSDYSFQFVTNWRFTNVDWRLLGRGYSVENLSSSDILFRLSWEVFYHCLGAFWPELMPPCIVHMQLPSSCYHDVGTSVISL